MACRRNPITRDAILCESEVSLVRTALHFASYMGHTEIGKHLLLTDDIDVNKICSVRDWNDVFDKQGGCGLTPINIAAFYGHYEICELLLSHPKLDSINKIDEIHGRTVLHYAVIRRKRETC